MATPSGSEYVELVGVSSTLLIGSAAIRLTDASDLLSVGPSRGEDTKLGGVPGRLRRTRTADALTDVLVGFKIFGQFDQDGATVADPVANALALQAIVKAFPDSESRAFTVRLTQYASSVESACSFEEFGPWARPDQSIFVGSFILSLDDSEAS